MWNVAVDLLGRIASLYDPLLDCSGPVAKHYFAHMFRLSIDAESFPSLVQIKEAHPEVY